MSVIRKVLLRAGSAAALVITLSQAAAAQGVVYTASNAAAGNHVIVYERDESGSLAFAGTVDTGGRGTGTGLGNQGGLVLSRDGQWLLVVNAASDDVSVFRVRGRDIELTSRTPSGGRRPVSVTIDRELVYVLNAGGAVGGVDTLAGFRLDRRGVLHGISGAAQALSGPSTAPAQVGFTPDGTHLVVTERATNLIGVFPLGDDGVARPGLFHASAGLTPFGFSFDGRGRLLVSEAGGEAPGGSSVSSYRLGPDGTLDTISAAVQTTQSATCWLVVTQNGRFLYTTNTGSGSVSALAVAPDGSLALRDADGVAATTGMASGPADAALSQGSGFLFTLNNGNRTISGFRVEPDGGLTPVSTLQVPAVFNGLAAR